MIGRALSRVNTLFVTFHSHAPDSRGHWSNRPRLESTPLLSFLEYGLLGGWYARALWPVGWASDTLSAPKALLSDSAGIQRLSGKLLRTVRLNEGAGDRGVDEGFSLRGSGLLDLTLTKTALPFSEFCLHSE